MVIIKDRLSKGVQNLVTKQWLEFFPEMKSIIRMDLMRRVGPLLICIELERHCNILQHQYWPCFFVHNLAREFLSLTTMLKLYLPTWTDCKYINIENHLGVYQKAARLIKEEAPIPLDGPISLDQVFKGYSNFQPSYYIDWLEDSLLIAAWAGEKKKAYQYLDWAEKIFKTWPETAQERHGGKNWRANLVAKIENPDELREITHTEVIKHKLEKVPYQDFIDVEYKEG